MLWYCFKCRRNTENENQKVLKKNIRRIMLYQNVQSAIVKKWDLLKSKKLELLSKWTGIKVPVLSDLPITNILF